MGKPAILKRMKKILLSLLLIHLVSPVLFSAEICEYRVTAFGISFARATIVTREQNGRLDHYVHVKNSFPASLIYPLDNRYLTRIDTKTGSPLKQEKYLGGVNGEYHFNLFTPGESGFFGDGMHYQAPDTPLHTLFSLFELIRRTRPGRTTQFSAVSCNTLWTVTVTPLSSASYRLTFASDAPISELKARYDDIFLKEVFWNSGEVDLFFNPHGRLDKAVLNSFSPPVTLSLTGWSMSLNKP